MRKRPKSYSGLHSGEAHPTALLSDVRESTQTKVEPTPERISSEDCATLLKLRADAKIAQLASENFELRVRLKYRIGNEERWDTAGNIVRQHHVPSPPRGTPVLTAPCDAPAAANTGKA